MEPMPVSTDQVNVGEDAIGLPNWSYPVAAKVCATFSCRFAVGGAMVMEFSVGLTITVTLLDAVPAPWLSAATAVST